MAGRHTRLIGIVFSGAEREFDQLELETYFSLLAMQSQE
jgi:hypothetical protein